MMSQKVRRTLAILVGLLALAGLGIGTPATDARAGTSSSWVEPVPAGGGGLAYEIGLGVRSAVRVRPHPVVEVSAMSFNVCGAVCHRGEVRATAGYVARTAVARKASVVLLQELCYGQFLQVRSLLAAKGYSGTFATTAQSASCAVADPKHRRGFGVAVLVRGSLRARVVKWLPTAPGVEKRVLLGVTAVVGGRSTFVAVVHLSPSAAAGLQGQLAVLAGYLNPKASKPLIVGGDFNALPDNPGLRGLYTAAAGGTGRFIEADQTRTGQVERGGAATFDIDGRKIDYVFLAQRWFSHPRAVSLATTMSDHHVYIGTARIAGG